MLLTTALYLKDQKKSQDCAQQASKLPTFHPFQLYSKLLSYPQRISDNRYNSLFLSRKGLLSCGKFLQFLIKNMSDPKKACPAGFALLKFHFINDINSNMVCFYIMIISAYLINKEVAIRCDAHSRHKT